MRMALFCLTAAAKEIPQGKVQLYRLGSILATSRKESIALSGCSFNRKLSPWK